MRALNHFYLSTPALYEIDFTENGFSWIYADEADRNMVAFRRHGLSGDEIIAVITFSGVDLHGIRIPVEDGAEYAIVFSSDASSPSSLWPKKNGDRYELELSLPRMSGFVLQKKK